MLNISDCPNIFSLLFQPSFAGYRPTFFNGMTRKLGADRQGAGNIGI